LIRTVISCLTYPNLFALSYDYVGDLSETVALMWPAESPGRNSSPTLGEIVDALNTAKKSDVPQLLASYLDMLDETGRWSLLKLVTGGLRIGVSARLAKPALAELADVEAVEIDEIWHGLAMASAPLFHWIVGRGRETFEHAPCPVPPANARPSDGRR